MCAPVHWAAGSDREMNFGVTGDAAPNAALSKVARYSRAARTAFSLISSGFQSLLGIERCLFASAAMRLRVDRKPVGGDQALGDTALHHALEKAAQHVALAKAPVSVLRERRVIGNPAVQSKPAEPAIGQIEVNLVAKAALGPNAHAVADDQHADHQLRINRGSAHLAVKRLQRLAEVIQIEVAVNAPKHVVGRDVVIEAKIVKQASRRHLNPHHRYLSRIRRGSESRPSLHINQSLTFSTISAQSGRLVSVELRCGAVTLG